MADMTTAYEALKNAHAAGDTKSAQKIADYIRANNNGLPPQEGVSSVAVHPVEMAADALKDTGNWFSSNEPKEVSLAEAGGNVAGGAVGGAVGGAALPGILKSVGKLIPGAIGKGLQGLGEVSSVVPLKERTIRGAGGGAVMGAVDAAGDAFGAPKALTLGAGLLGGGFGESAASFLGKESSQLLKFIGNASYGNIAGASRALGGMIRPNQALNTEMASRVQAKLFGNKLDTYIDAPVASTNRIATQEALRKADPSLNAGPRAADSGTRPAWQDTSEAGVLHPSSGATDLTTPGAGMPAGFGAPTTAPGLGGPTINMGTDVQRNAVAVSGGNPVGAAAVPGANGAPAKQASAATATDPAFGAAKAAAQGKGLSAREAAAKEQEAAAAEALKPASQIYRERMFNGVTEAVKSGKSFSSTPEYGQFAAELQHQVTMGNVPKAKAAELLRQLRLDQAKGAGNGKVLGAYAEQVDNNIRQWGKPAEGSIATGADAIDSKVAGNVRDALRTAYNQYTTRLGLGPIEQKYRGAYSAEMVAEAKDKMPQFLNGFGKGKEFDKFARNLSSDPQGKQVLLQGVGQFLAQQEPKKIVQAFDTVRGALVNGGLVQPNDLQQLRVGANTVKRIADKGQQLRAGQQLKQMLLLALSRQGGAAAGGAAAAPQQQ